MKKRKNVKIKKNITLVDEINATQFIVDSYFKDGDFTPYYSEMAKIIAVAENFLEGVTFEEEDLIYELVMNDKGLYSLVLKFFYNVEDSDEAKKENEDNLEYINLMNRITSNVAQIVEFEKQKIISKSTQTELLAMISEQNKSLNTIAEFCDVISKSLVNFSNLNLSKMTQEDMQMARDFMTQLKGKNITETTLSNAIQKVVNKHKVPNTKIYEGQRQRIAEQQKQLQEKDSELVELKKWKQDHEARNVINDK